MNQFKINDLKIRQARKLCKLHNITIPPKSDLEMVKGKLFEKLNAETVEISFDLMTKDQLQIVCKRRYSFQNKDEY